MDYLLAGIGLALAAVGVGAACLPHQLTMRLRSWDSHRLFLIGVVIRVGIGIVCMTAAPLTRYPTAVYILGGIAIAAALVLVILGPKRLDGLITWWARQPIALIRAGSLAAAGFGAFLLYAAL